MEFFPLTPPPQIFKTLDRCFHEPGRLGNPREPRKISFLFFPEKKKREFWWTFNFFQTVELRTRKETCHMTVLWNQCVPLVILLVSCLSAQQKSFGQRLSTLCPNLVESSIIAEGWNWRLSYCPHVAEQTWQRLNTSDKKMYCRCHLNSAWSVGGLMAMLVSMVTCLIALEGRRDGAQGIKLEARARSPCRRARAARHSSATNLRAKLITVHKSHVLFSPYLLIVQFFDGFFLSKLVNFEAFVSMRLVR